MKTQSYLLGLAILAAGCSQSKQTQGYSIEGEVKGVETGKVWLSSFDDATRTSNLIDSAIITNGKFSLKGNEKDAKMVSMSIGEQNFGLSFFLENSKISIKADTSGSQYYDYSSYGGGKGAQLKNYTVSGSTNEDQWKSFSNNPLLKRFDPVLADLNKANMPSRVGTLYMTPYLPCYILLDKEEKIILHNPSKEQLDEKLKELLGAS
jgi:hypothetical protein